MNMLKYDIATLGNHDFDSSIDVLFKQIPNAKFDSVSANYDLKKLSFKHNIFTKPTIVKNIDDKIYL